MGKHFFKDFSEENKKLLVDEEVLKSKLSYRALNVLLYIFFFPVMILIKIIRSSKVTFETKIFVVCIVGMILIAICTGTKFT